MTDPIDIFFEAWSEQDRAKRDEMVAGALGDSIYYADPRTEAALTDAGAVTDYVGQFSQMAPGMPVSVIHKSRTLDHVRAAVRFGTAEQGQLGQYVADTDANGRITRLVGFVGLGQPD